MGGAPGRDALVAVPVATVWVSPHAPRPVDATAVGDRPDVAGWLAALDADPAGRRGLHGRCETQLLLGERVRVVRELGGWSAVRAPGQPTTTDAGGYPGWVRTAHLTPPGTVGEPGLDAVVARPTCLGAGRETVVELSLGSRVRVLDRHEPVATVALPGGPEVAVPRAALRPLPAAAPRADDVLALARELLGLPYLWGGTSAWGLDCSGLVDLVLRSFGVVVPRDAADQAARLPAVPVEEAAPGDLYFFASGGDLVDHVGLVTRRPTPDGRRWMLHAPETGRGVEETELPPGRASTLVSAARALPG